MGYITKAVEFVGVRIGATHAAFFTTVTVADNLSIVIPDYDKVVSGNNIKMRNVIV